MTQWMFIPLSFSRLSMYYFHEFMPFCGQKSYYHFSCEYKIAGVKTKYKIMRETKKNQFQTSTEKSVLIDTSTI